MRALPIATLCLVILAICACSDSHRGSYRQAARMTGGDPHTGKLKIRNYGCQACHTIPGIPGADSLVGPPLTNIGSRMVLAGELPNTPANLAYWIQHPHAVEPHTLMPEMGVTEQDSRDIAAYLYTLR
jgi:cytochrome c